MRQPEAVHWYCKPGPCNTENTRETIKCGPPVFPKKHLGSLPPGSGCSMPLPSSAAPEVPTKMEEGFGMLNFARRQIMPQANCVAAPLPRTIVGECTVPSGPRTRTSKHSPPIPVFPRTLPLPRTARLSTGGSEAETCSTGSRARACQRRPNMSAL